MSTATQEMTTPRKRAGESARRQIVEELTKSYWMEIETIQNYLANSVNLDGIRAKEIKESLAEDLQEELDHATRLAERIHILGGKVPGSEKFQWSQKKLQPPRESTDVLSVILGVIAAEEGAIDQYRRIVELCDGIDYATQDLCIELMANEQAHRREFIGYLAELDKEQARELANGG